MSELFAVGIDVGSSSTKTTIHDLSGTLIAFGKADYTPTETAGGSVEYAPDDILSAVERSLADAVRASELDPSQIVAITTDAMVSGAVGLGADGHPTTAYTTTLDTRFNKDLEEMVKLHERELRKLVGSSSPVVAAKASWYRRTQPGAYENTNVFVTAGGLVGAHLAGLEPGSEFIDPTVLWAVGLSDTRNGAWSTSLADKLDVPLSLMPRIVPSTTVVGGLASTIAHRVGLLSGTPIVAGMGDQMAGFLGAGMLGGDRIADSAGTYAVVGRRVDQFAPDEKGIFEVVPSPTGPGFVEQSVVVIGGGFTRRWFEERIEAGADPDLSSDSQVAAIAAGSNGLVFVPHFGGQSSPSRPWLNGAWLGLNWEHGKGHLKRSMMEAMAFEVANALDAMVVDLRVDIVGYGGGTLSTVGNQIKADVTGRTYISLGDIAPASRAAALLGAAATGHLDSLAAVLERTATPQRTFYPDAAKVATYKRLRTDYSRAIEVVSAFCHASSARSSTI